MVFPPRQFPTVAIVSPDPALAYRRKAKLLVAGYRQVDVFLSQRSLEEAMVAGYHPDRVVSDDAASAPTGRVQ